jgi:hypothetical protein
MPNCKVTILVESINVISNGDVPKSSPNHAGGAKNNAIAASLIYPRGGYPQISSVVQADLESNVRKTFGTDFFGPNGDGVDSPGLFKGEEIDDYAPVKIQVTANTNADQLSAFIDKVFSGLLTAGAKLVPGGSVVAAVLGAITGGIGDQITNASKGSSPTPVEVIGAATYKLDVASVLGANSPLRVVLPLIAPKTINKSWYELQSPPGGGPQQLVQVSGNLTTQGQPNGTINLLVTVG